MSIKNKNESFRLHSKKISTFTNHVFSGQGGSVVHILDSLSKIKKVKIIPSQNEQGASFGS